MDEGRPGNTYSTESSASDHGRAYAAQHDMSNQEITIKDSFVLVVTRRVEETMERAQHAENLLGGVDELKKRLTAMTEAARIAATRLKQEVQRAREAGRAEALAEAESRLQDAELRRDQVEARLKQAQAERDRATQLMEQAQLQALAARNELEELRRREQLEAELARARPQLQRAADAGGTVREDVYADQIASADAELGDFRDQLAQLSAELKESSEAETETEAGASKGDTPAAVSPVADSASAPPISVNGRAAQVPPGASGQQHSTLAPLWVKAPVSTVGGRTKRPIKSSSKPRRSWHFGAVASIPILACCAIDGAGTNIMINAPTGPAILWQVVYALSVTMALVFIAFLVFGLISEVGKAWNDQAQTVYVGLFIFVGPLVLIGTMIFSARTLPLLGLIAHWLVYHLGPM